MKTGDTIQLAESTGYFIKQLVDRHRILATLLYEIGTQMAAADDDLWRFIRETYPETVDHEICIDRDRSVLIVGSKRNRECPSDGGQQGR